MSEPLKIRQMLPSRAISHLLVGLLREEYIRLYPSLPTHGPKIKEWLHVMVQDPNWKLSAVIGYLDNIYVFNCSGCKTGYYGVEQCPNCKQCSSCGMIEGTSAVCPTCSHSKETM